MINREFLILLSEILDLNLWCLCSFKPLWWSGGIAGSISHFVVTPFDVLESRMIVLKEKRSILQAAKESIQKHGFLSLYDGVSAQIFRQVTYMTLRFYLYDKGKAYVDERNLLHKICVAGGSGLLAGLVGIPSEMINTRMQVDRELRPAIRRNYHHVFNGLYRVIRDEGFRALYTGGMYSASRAIVVAIGQNAMYDQSKMFYKKYFDYKESKSLHLLSSLTAGLITAPLVQPIEVLKTMQMSSSNSLYPTLADKLLFMSRFGVRGLFIGFTAALCQMIPNTIITFLVYEQLRLRYGH